MHALKKKIMHELEKLENEESASGREISFATLGLAKELAKTYYYLCKIEHEYSNYPHKKPEMEKENTGMFK